MQNLIKRHSPYSSQVPIDSLYSNAIYKANNDYQRGVVWSKQDQIDFVEYVCKGGAFGSIVVETYQETEIDEETKKFIFNLVDGQQRVTAVIQFIENKIPIFNNVYFKDLTKEDSWNFRRISITRVALDYYTQKEIAQYYILLNTKGKIHKRDDIEKAENYLASLI